MRYVKFFWDVMQGLGITAIITGCALGLLLSVLSGYLDKLMYILMF